MVNISLPLKKMKRLTTIYKNVNKNAKKLMDSLDELDQTGNYQTMIRVKDESGMSLNQLPVVFALNKIIEISDKLSKGKE